MTSYRNDLLYIGIVALAVVIWFHPFFVLGEVLVPPNATSAYPWYGSEAYTEPHPQGSMDAVRENYISWALHHRYLEEGHAPNWNPYILGGNPMLANQFATPYSPFKLLNLIFSAPVAWSWGIVLKSFLNGLFTFLTLRALKRSPIAATIGALAWMLSWPLAHQTQTTYSEGVALMPAVFFFALKSFQAVRWRRQWMFGIAASIVAGFQFLSGNIQMTIFACVIVFALALYWTVYENCGARPLLTAIAIYVGGALVGAVQLWSSYELIDLSIRGAAQTHTNRGVEFYSSLSFLNPWIYLWRNFEFPELRVEYWQTFRWNPFIGLIPLLGFVVTLRFVRDKLARTMAISVVAIWVILHLMNFGPIFRLVNGLPGYDALEHARLLIVLPFPMILAAAYGVDWLLDEGANRWREFRPVLWLASLAIPAMLALLVGVTIFFVGEETSALGDSAADMETVIGTKIFADYYNITNPLFLASIIFGVIALVMVYQLHGTRVPPHVIGWMLVMLVAAEMLIFAKVNVASTQSDNLYPTTPAIEFLQARMDDEVFRVGAAPNTLYEGRAGGEYANYRDDHGWYLSSLLPVMIPNSAAMFGLQDVRGYESVYTLRYSDYLARADGRDDPFGAVAIPTNNTVNPMFDALNMRYVLSVEAIEHPALAEVYADEIFIYENQNALPRVVLYEDFRVMDGPEAVLNRMSEEDFEPARELLFEDDPGFELPSSESADFDDAEAQVTLYEPNRVMIEVSAPTDAILLLNDIHYPGWVARVDGAATPIARANTIMRAVEVPAGVHTVEFIYESAPIRDGGRLSLLSFGVLVVALASLVLAEGRKQPS